MGEFVGGGEPAVLDRLSTVKARVSLDALVPRLRASIVVGFFAGAMVFFSAGMQFATSGGAAALFAPLLMGGMYGCALAAMLTRRLAVTEGELSRTGFLARSLHLSQGAVAGIYITEARVPGGQTAPVVLFLGQDNRCLLRLNGRAWRRDDLEAIAGALAAPLEVNTRAALDARSVNEQFPGSFSSLELNSGRLTLVVVGVSIAVIAFFASILLGRVR